MGTNIKASIKEENFMEEENISGLMDHLTKASSNKE